MNKKVQNLIASRNTESLIEMFEHTETMQGDEIPTVRGWIMEELERRNTDAFDVWISEHYDASPRQFFMG
jgi:hypothetical protein